MKPIKGQWNKPPEKIPPTLGASVDSILKQRDSLEVLKKDVVKAVDAKIVEVDNSLKKVHIELKEVGDVRKVIDTTHAFIQNKSAIFNDAIQHLKNLTDEARTLIEGTKEEALQLVAESQGPQGEPGNDADEERIIDAVIKRIPPVDENKLLTKFLKKIPEKKGDLKIIQEKVEIDPMSVIDRILELAKDGKFKINTKNIDGLDQTISAFNNQIGRRGYLHGGGTTVVAGANITLVNLPNGTTQVNSSVPPAILSLLTNGVQNASQTILNLVAGSGITLSNSGGTVTITNSSSSSGITSISIASANGFAGSSSGGTSPALTLTTTITGILLGNGTSISAAASSDIISALGYTPYNATNPAGYITSASLPVGANPTASVGLTTVNGSATTFLRSDGAPALSQSIAPTWTGVHTFSPTARTTGAASYLTVNAPADTGITASTESIGIKITGATRTWVDGTTTTQREYVFGAPTYNKTTTSATFTNAATVAITGAPTAGSGVTLTNAWSLWVQGGNTRFDGAYARFGTLAPYLALTKGADFIGTDNTINGVQIGVENQSGGTSAYNGVYLNNNLAVDGLVDHFVFLGQNSSTYSDTTFGTLFAVANLAYLQNTDAAIAYITSSTSTGGHIFYDGGTSTSNEIFRLTKTNITASVTGIYNKAQRGAFYTLTDASTIAVDASQGNNFFVVLGGNRTLGVPTNPVAGQTGVISVMQDITGSRTLAYAWPYQFAGGTAPTLSTGKLVLDQLYYSINKYATATVTMTIASPCVVTWTGHGLSSGDRIQLTTTGALPTGLSASTTYWVTVIDANTFKLSSSLANAQAATFINTSGSQSGTHTAVNFSITIANALAIA